MGYFISSFALSKKQHKMRDKIEKLSFKPIQLNPTLAADRKFLKTLRKRGVYIHDEIDKQIAELVKLRHPNSNLNQKQQAKLSKIVTGDTDPGKYGLWFYYPWLNTVVHTLPESEFIEVRTNRNKFKISDAEQHILKSKKIGIIGMSLGGAIAIALATERNFGEIVLADFDYLELANLNRISFGIHQLGIPKVIVTARKIAELDPYLNVTIFPEGITGQTIELFINNIKKLDLIIEECDDIEIKYKTRVIAKKLRIPVLMQTNAKPMLDIERFDLDPQRALFHGRIEGISNWNWKKIKNLAVPQRLIYLLQFVGEEGLTDILKISLEEMGKSLSGFCQPASTFALGSGIACEMTRLILLNKHQMSGRYIFDIDAWLAGPPIEIASLNRQDINTRKMTA
jgi:hypothetical protein